MIKQCIRRWLITLFAVLTLLPQAALAVEVQIPAREMFDAAAMDSSLTIAQAMERYPEITDIYCIKIVREEEALQRVAQGERLFILDDGTSFQDILLSVNARKNVAVTEPDFVKLRPAGVMADSSYGSGI